MLRYMYMCTSSANADETWCPVFLSQEAQHISCICILLEVFFILVASNTMSLEIL